MSELPPGEFGAYIESRDEVAVVVARGDVDAASAPEFRSVIQAAAATGARLEIDLSATTFMDSSGLSALIAAHQQFGAQDYPVVLRDPSPVVCRLLEVAGVVDMLEVRQTLT